MADDNAWLCLRFAEYVVCRTRSSKVSDKGVNQQFQSLKETASITPSMISDETGGND
jgi:hypothetical protein